MTQEDKDLLIKDLCARLPYGVKCAIFNKDLRFWGIPGFEGKYPFVIDGITQEGDDTDVWVEHGNFSLETIKPYLFPMSSMTEEQTDAWRDYWFPDLITSTKVNYPESKKYIAISHSKSMKWLYKHHFDVNGLIPKGLANDATGKNIY